VKENEQHICKPCPEGRSQPLDGQRGIEACKRCPDGKLPTGPPEYDCEDCESGKYSDGGECKKCPSGTSAANASAGCTPCEPGFMSQETGKDFCKPCTRTSKASCPVGSDSELLKGQQDDWRQAQSKDAKQGNAGRHVKDGSSTAERETHASNHYVISQDLFLGIISSLLAIILIIIACHRLMPKKVFLEFDFFDFSHKHTTGQGTPKVRLNTALGGACSVAFVFLILIIALVLWNSNKLVEQNLYGLPHDEPVRSNLELILHFPLRPENEQCQQLRMETFKFDSLDCMQEEVQNTKYGCKISALNCTIPDKATVEVDIGWSVRYVSWELLMKAPKPDHKSSIKGLVSTMTCKDGKCEDRTEMLIKLNPSSTSQERAESAPAARVLVQAIPTYRNDTRITGPGCCLRDSSSSNAQASQGW